MIRFSAALVVVAIGILVSGIATSSLPLVYGAIGVSVLALAVLAVGVALRRDELFGEGARSAVSDAQPSAVQPTAVQSAGLPGLHAASGVQAGAQVPVAAGASPFGAPLAGGWPPPPSGFPAGPAAPAGTPAFGKPGAFRRRPAPPTRADPVVPWADALPTRVDVGKSKSPDPVPSWLEDVDDAPAAAPLAARVPSVPPAGPVSAPGADVPPAPGAGSPDAPPASEAGSPDAPPAAAVGSPGTALLGGGDVTVDADVPGGADLPAGTPALPADAAALLAGWAALPAGQAAPPADPAAAKTEALDLGAIASPGAATAGSNAEPPAPADAAPADAEPADAEPADTMDAAPADAEPAGTTEADAESEPAETEPADSEPAATEPADSEPAATEPAPASAASTSGQVSVIPGVPRFHDPECILIRFMKDEDVQRMTVAEAEQAGCTPCTACQPG